MVGYNASVLLDRPAWLKALLTEKFFIACLRHAALKKNERNIFCVDCSDSICQHCLPAHQNHHLLQIRRYVYHDVIRLHDIQKLFDCAQVQAYIINSARVVFLNQRPQPRPSKVLGNACETCERSLQDSYRYCSVACKVDAFLGQGKNLHQFLPPRSHSLNLSDNLTSQSVKVERLELQQGQLSPSWISDDPTSQTSSEGGDCVTVTWVAMAVLPPKKIRSSRSLGVCASTKAFILPSSVNRRKGTPHRSPFC
ncbi:hypothetical protein O6H91_09G036400 [Diphasiastrum complanatum]|uniref:Uncharacterized protein n=1 Tax=Diphasiastrum complanatum TaxID=34168 RepID=A0ACC2CN95_DIPCM|nr:hypothetical protein O6H91_09G036400 [Diphasiastrum complanatum]